MKKPLSVPIGTGGFFCSFVLEERAKKQGVDHVESHGKRVNDSGYNANTSHRYEFLSFIVMKNIVE